MLALGPTTTVILTKPNNTTDCKKNKKNNKKLEAFSAVLSDEQRARANRIEMLDEIEEWQMIMSHYVLVVGENINVEQNEKFSLLPQTR